MEGMWVSRGRAPSCVWMTAARELAAYGMTPAEYICEMRSEGASWAEIGRSIAEDCGLRRPTGAGTLQYWVNVEPLIAREHWPST